MAHLPKNQMIGVLTAAALLCGSVALPSAALADDTTDVTDQTVAALMAGTTSDTIGTTADTTDTTADSADDALTQAEEAINASSDTADALAEAADADTDGSGDAATRAVADKDELKALLDTTEESDLTPLASGYRADDSGTAPYDTYQANADDLTALNEARDAAQQVVDDADATEAEITAAGDALSEAFDAVRFIYHYTGITGTNGARMYDNNGNLIQAHGAGIVKAKTSTLAEADRALDENGDGYVYIWCGEDKTDRLVAHGVRIYYSDDLYNWTDKGLGFQTYLGDADLEDKLNGADEVYQQYYNVDNIATDPDYTNIYGEDFRTFADDSSNYNIDSPQDALDKLLWDLKALYGDGSDATKTSCVFERPKMAYNEYTNRWVIWFHADGPQYGNEDTATYSKAKAGVAVSVTGDPAGPYKYLGSFRMSPGTNTTNPGMARDMNLYIDEGKDENNDGADDAYLIYASNENADLTISLLDATYTKLVVPVSEQQRGTSVKDGDTYNIIATNSKESPAPVKWNGHYYFIYSHTTGWAPNENEYTKSESDNIMGPYHEIGTPFVDGDGYEQSHTNSFYTQSSSIISVDAAKGLFIYWGDRWFNPDTGNDISQSRYVMTPIQFVNGELRVLPAADWSLDDMDNYQAVDVESELPTATGSMSDLMASLPDTLDVRVGGSSEVVSTPVSWDPYFGADQPTGSVAVTGTLTELGGTTISFTVNVYPKSTVLFMDAGSDPDNESEYYRELVKQADGLINADHSDQLYSAGGWGLSSVIGTDVEAYETDSNDINATGYWAKSGKSIEYKADLKAGTYTVQAGYKEWWSNKRNTVFTASANGTTLAETTIVPAQSGNTTDALVFTLDEDATVTFLTKSTSGGDPVLSWISVNEVSDDQVMSVEATATQAFLAGTEPELPATVNVTMADGSTEERTVTWLYDGSAISDYAPATVQGVVAGTTLPATATVQRIPTGLEYFIDVNGTADSPTYAAANTLTEGGLVNATADQTFAEADGWGNTSSNYGTKNAGTADPFESGIYAGANGTADDLSYQLTLGAGTHTLAVGMHDWWSVTRPTTVTYQIDGEASATLGTASVGSGDTVVSGEITIPDGESKVVTITLASAEGTGPVLSWIAAGAVESEEPDPEPEPTPDPEPVSVGEVNVSVEAGQTPDLPATVQVTYSDGTTSDVAVTWESYDWASATAGSVVEIVGDLDGINPGVLRATATVTVTAAPVDPLPLNAAPVITGADDMTIALGASFDAMAGVTASDEEDGDLTEEITVSGTVDTATAGVYTLTYTVSDTAGASCTVMRTVAVEADDEPKPEPTPDPEPEPTPSDDEAADDAVADDAVADTGSTVTAVAATGAALLLAAGAALALRRRNR